MALAAFVSAHALEMTVFDGASMNSTVPIDIDHYYFNGHSQVIFPESALTEMVGSEINSMKFYLDRTINVTNDGLVRISMGVTNQDRFYFTEYISADMTVLTNYSVPNGVSELVITFDQPFKYNGGNLLFESEQITEGSRIVGYFYGVNPGYDSSFSYHILYRFLPKTTFDYTPVDENNGMVTPQELDFGKLIKGNEVTRAITLKNIGINAFTPSFGTVAAPFIINTQPVELAPLQSMEILVTCNAASYGIFADRLIIDCGSDGTISVPLTASCLAQVDVAEGTDKYNYIPMSLQYYDMTKTNYSQVIYPANMLTFLEGKKMNSLKFYCDGHLDMLSNGKVKVSLKEVDITGFADVDQVSNMAVVAEVTPTFKGNEMLLTFDTPFEYHGGNLAVEVALTEPGNNAVFRHFLGRDMDELVSFHRLGDSPDEIYSKTRFLPMASFGFVDDGDAPQSEFEKGDVDHDHSINIADVTALIDFLLNGQTAPSSADCNLDGSVNISDVTCLIDFLLSGSWPAEEIVYTVVGPESVFGSNWDPSDEANDMVKGEDGTYTLTKVAVALDGNFKFKIVGNHNWNTYEWPTGPNNWVAEITEVAENGLYDIVITFNPEADEANRITCTVTEAQIEHVYTVVGTYNLFEVDWDLNYEGNNMVKGSDGIYRLNKTGWFTEGTDIRFKVVQDHSYAHSWPAEDFLIGIYKTGAFNFEIIFNPYNNDEDKIAVNITEIF